MERNLWISDSGRRPSLLSLPCYKTSDRQLNGWRFCTLLLILLIAISIERQCIPSQIGSPSSTVKLILLSLLRSEPLWIMMNCLLSLVSSMRSKSVGTALSLGSLVTSSVDELSVARSTYELRSISEARVTSSSSLYKAFLWIY